MSCSAGRCCHRGTWRSFRERAYLRPYIAATELDESALAALVKPEMADAERTMRSLMTRGMNHNQALLASSRTFNDRMAEFTLKKIQERDMRVCRVVDARGAAALYALRQLGALDPPWLTWWQRGADSATTESPVSASSVAVKRALDELAHSLDSSRAYREYTLRSNVIRTETGQGYEKARQPPRQLALPQVDHVLSTADVARLREGETLVLDPQPALLTPEQMAVAHADLMRMVKAGGGVVESQNPCNRGSYHGMLPVDPEMARKAGLAESTCVLLRKLVGLPALVERHGWPRQLAMPGMVQLGFYPGGSGARYRPHLDRYASEVNNRRELTMLVYLNVGWDAATAGGCLRLHPDGNRRHDGQEECVGGRTATPAGCRDVQPIAGRLVIFQSGMQWHEVCESTIGKDRLALTLWVEYEESWKALQ